MADREKIKELLHAELHEFSVIAFLFVSTATAIGFVLFQHNFWLYNLNLLILCPITVFFIWTLYLLFYKYFTIKRLKSFL